MISHGQHYVEQVQHWVLWVGIVLAAAGFASGVISLEQLVLSLGCAN
jgi:hypothetical protein